LPAQEQRLEGPGDWPGRLLEPVTTPAVGWDIRRYKSDAARQIPVIVTATREKSRHFQTKRMTLPVQQQVLQQVLTLCATPLISQSGKALLKAPVLYPTDNSAVGHSSLEARSDALVALRSQVTLAPLSLFNHRV